MLPTGGSKADGTVELAYEYCWLEIPQVDNDEALKTATKRCAAWGYKSSEPFAGVVSTCKSFNRYGDCMYYHVTQNFQCLDN